MIRTLLGVLVLLSCLWKVPAFAQDKPVTATNIPYKTTTPLEEHGSRVGLVLLIFMVASGAAIYLIRKRIPKLTQAMGKKGHVKVKESIKLNPRCTLYVVEFNQRELLIGQSGDNLVCLSNICLEATDKENPDV